MEYRWLLVHGFVRNQPAAVGDEIVDLIS